MSFPKMVFYDWTGANETLFLAINGAIGGETYNTIMVLASSLTQPKYFGVFIAMMVFCALLDWGLRKLRQRGGADHALIGWFGAVCVFVVAYGIDSAVVGAAKHFFGYARPYVLIAPEEMVMLEYHSDLAENYRAFPSGHVSFIAVLATALWTVLSSGTRNILLVGVALVAWSRVAVGMHFPADVVYGALLGLLITVPVRWYLYALLLRFFHLKC